MLSPALSASPLSLLQWQTHTKYHTSREELRIFLIGWTHLLLATVVAFGCPLCRAELPPDATALVHWAASSKASSGTKAGQDDCILHRTGLIICEQGGELKTQVVKSVCLNDILRRFPSPFPACKQDHGQALAITYSRVCTAALPNSWASPKFPKGSDRQYGPLSMKLSHQNIWVRIWPGKK